MLVGVDPGIVTVGAVLTAQDQSIRVVVTRRNGLLVTGFVAEQLQQGDL